MNTKVITESRMNSKYIDKFLGVSNGMNIFYKYLILGENTLNGREHVLWSWQFISLCKEWGGAQKAADKEVNMKKGSRPSLINPGVNTSIGLQPNIKVRRLFKSHHGAMSLLFSGNHGGCSPKTNIR